MVDMITDYTSLLRKNKIWLCS